MKQKPLYIFPNEAQKIILSNGLREEYLESRLRSVKVSEMTDRQLWELLVYNPLIFSYLTGVVFDGDFKNPIHTKRHVKKHKHLFKDISFVLYRRSNIYAWILAKLKARKTKKKKTIMSDPNK